MESLLRRVGFEERDANEINDVYNAVLKSNNVSYMKDPQTPRGENGFVFCKDPEITDIKRHLQYRKGSGASLALALRATQHLLVEPDDFVNVNFSYFYRYHQDKDFLQVQVEQLKLDFLKYLLDKK